MTADAAAVELVFTWRYNHALGGLTPYFDGLLAGRAVATRCRVCGRAWFPPRLSCPDHGAAIDWTTLSGHGNIIVATRTAVALPLTERTEAAWFALIAMDGAQNATVGRLLFEGAATPGLRVRLERDAGAIAHPAQAACFRPIPLPCPEGDPGYAVAASLSRQS